MSELVSVVVLSYNSQSTISETLDSIKAQTYKNIEIVVADDHSSDDTVACVQKWQSDNGFSALRIVTSSENTGITANTNRGVRAAKANAVKIIAGDDTLNVKAIETFYEYYSKGDSKTIFVSCTALIDENGTPFHEPFHEAWLKDCYKSICSDDQFHRIVRSNFISAPAVGLIHKSIFEKYGYFDERYPMMEDYPFYLKLSENGIRYSLIREKLVNYRISSRSVVHAKKSKAQKMYLRSYSDFIIHRRFKLLLKEGYYKTAVKEVLKLVRNFFTLHVR